MISTETNNFYHNLCDILHELNKYHRNKEDLKLFYLNKRLNKSLETYYHDIVQTFEYLDYRDNDNLIRKYKGVMK